MDEPRTSDNTFETRLDISVSVDLAVESRSDPLEESHWKSRRLIEQELIDLQKSGLRPEFLALLNKQTGERVYKFTSNPLKEDDIFLRGMGGIGKTSLLPYLIETVRFVVQLSSDISQGIAEHKTALDIFTDFATIIGATIPVTGIVFKVLHLDKAHHKSEKIPSVTITIGDVSVNVADEDIKDAEHAATNIARKLLKEHPEALPSNKVNVSGKLIETPKQQRTPASPQQKPRKKRSK